MNYHECSLEAELYYCTNSLFDSMRESKIGSTRIYNCDVMDVYDEWESPTVIVSDGAYGVNGFDNDPSTPKDLKEWYEPHVQEWSRMATPETTLWFWNTEQGWAEVHPLLEENNWEYRGANIWNKGIQHISGNSNTQKIRKFPQVTEMCVQYVKKPVFEIDGTESSMQEWLRYEWDRTELNLYEANDACNVSNAASRKYLAKDDKWYFPPSEAFVNMAEYANEHGEESGKPYFTINGDVPTEEEWNKMRAKFNCPQGVTNVWSEPPLHNQERFKNDKGNYVHLNQKPLKLIKRIVEASSERDDVVWSPFAGLSTTGVVCNSTNRRCFAAEIVDQYYELSVKRLESEV